MSSRSTEHFRTLRESDAPLSRHSMNQKIAGLSIEGQRRVFGKPTSHEKRMKRLSKKMARDAIRIGQMGDLLQKGFRGEELTEEEASYLDKALSEHEECVEIFEEHGQRVTVTVVDLTKLQEPFASFGEPSIFRRQES